MKKRVWKNILLIALFTGFIAFVDNPWKFPALEKDIPVVTPLWNWIQGSQVSLGLDLQGGTQLDYEIDLTDARARNNDADPDNDVDISTLLDGVKDVIEKRVNSLGVAEPNIYLSSAGDEEHIVVELPGVKDIQEAKEKVGKVVQLEFKTEKAEPSPEEVEQISQDAAELLKKIRAEETIEDLEAFIEDVQIPNQVEYRKDEKAFEDELPEEFKTLVKTLQPGAIHSEVVRAKEATYIYNDGQLQQPEGFNIIRLVERSPELRKRPVNAEDFAKVVNEIGGTTSEDYFHFDDIQPSELANEVSALENSEVTGLIETSQGFYIAKLVNKLPIDESAGANEQIRTSHILLKTEPLETAVLEKPLKEIPENASEEERAKIESENQTIAQENEQIKEQNAALEVRNAEKIAKNLEIKTKAEGILAQVKENPERFSELAKEFSEDSSAEKGGDLGYSAPDAYVAPYRDAALALEEGAFTQELVESQFGYHIIKLVDTKQADEELYQYSAIHVCFAGAANCDSELTKEEAKTKADEALKRVREEPTYTLERVWFNAVPDPWAKTELDARYFKRADVAYDQITYRPYVSITFNDEGAKLFEELTANNINKRIGIFVGGEFISAPVVQEKISGGNAQISMGTPNVQLALQEADELARSLNAGSIPAPLKKPNELNIGASLGTEALQKSLHAGLIGVILVALFMLLYYRFLGLLATVSLLIYGLFLMFVIQSQVPPFIALIVSLVLWIAFVFRLFKTRIDGLGKAIFLIMSVLGVLFVFSVLVSPIVLTLAGIAGILLSIGMAVDANILIFERIKEEFAQGKTYLAAVNDGFERAWSSILDSNVSSLITCAILFSFGTSIIKGFAINLAVGIVISMFTAITVTRIFMLAFQGTALEKIDWLWKRKKSKN
jgi:protein-export membrane protein SecD